MRTRWWPTRRQLNNKLTCGTTSAPKEMHLLVSRRSVDCAVFLCFHKPRHKFYFYFWHFRDSLQRLFRGRISNTIWQILLISEHQITYRNFIKNFWQYACEFVKILKNLWCYRRIWNLLIDSRYHWNDKSAIAQYTELSGQTHGNYFGKRLV